MLVFRKILRTYVLNRWYLNLFTETLDDFKTTLNKWFYCQPWKKDQHLRKHFMVSFIKIFPLIWKVCFFVDLFRLTFAHFSRNIWLQRFWWVICKLVWLKSKIREEHLWWLENRHFILTLFLLQKQRFLAQRNCWAEVDKRVPRET